MNTEKQQKTASGAPEAPIVREHTIPLAKIKKLEKRMGPRIWDGVLFQRDSITNPMLAVLQNKVGREIVEILKLEEIENCSHAPCVCGRIRQFKQLRAKMNTQQTDITAGAGQNRAITADEIREIFNRASLEAYAQSWRTRASEAEAQCDELLAAMKFLTREIHLGKLNIRKDFSLINAHAAALKAIARCEGGAQ